MDLLLIARKMWRHKLVTIPVIVLTIAGAAYAVAVKEPVYEATASYLLVNPPPAPTADQIARNPELGRIRADNPYTRFADQSVVIDVLARTMSSESARRTLLRAGADPRYTVSSAAQFGTSTPIIQIAGPGPTPGAAIRTATVVSHAVVGELDRMQKDKDVDAGYRITTFQVEKPDNARLRASGQLRMLVGVLVLGTVVLFIVLSVTDALETLRRERWAASAPEWTSADLAFLDQDRGMEPAARTNGRADELQVPEPNEERPT
jgi:hypothetical protein